jgi:hypothetical protein
MILVWEHWATLETSIRYEYIFEASDGWYKSLTTALEITPPAQAPKASKNLKNISHSTVVEMAHPTEATTKIKSPIYKGGFLPYLSEIGP